MNATELISPEPSRRTMNGLRELLLRQLVDGLRAGNISSGQASASAKHAQLAYTNASPRYGWNVDAGWAQREAGEPSANDERLARFRRQWSVLARLGIVE
jgi:hypothetical protein